MRHMHRNCALEQDPARRDARGLERQRAAAALTRARDGDNVADDVVLGGTVGHGVSIRASRLTHLPRAMLADTSLLSTAPPTP